MSGLPCLGGRGGGDGAGGGRGGGGGHGLGWVWGGRSVLLLTRVGVGGL